MAYSKYYPEGWKNNESGATPITAGALNHMETGIKTAVDNMDNTGSNVVTYTSEDQADSAVTRSTGWTTVSALVSGMTHSNLFNSMSKMFKNIRWLYKMLGTTDISSISSAGTVTGAIAKLNTDVNDYSHLSFTVYSNRVTVLESSTYRCGEFVIVYFKCTANQALNENTIIQGLPVPGAKQGLSVNLGSAWAEIRASAADGIVAANISNGQTFVLFGVYNILGVPN